MVLRFFGGSRQDKLEHVQQTLLAMLFDDRHSFDLAMSALLAGADPTIIGPELRETDQKVNEGERSIRRELLVHASVHGTRDVPVILIYMSIVKDVERIGDYAKNIYDLAAQRRDLNDSPDIESLRTLGNRVSGMITECSRLFAADDVDGARDMIQMADEMLDECDEQVEALVVTREPGRDAVIRALFYRYLKRIVSHLMNVLSAIVMPVDQLDYFDEIKGDRNS